MENLSPLNLKVKHNALNRNNENYNLTPFNVIDELYSDINLLPLWVYGVYAVGIFMILCVAYYIFLINSII